MPDNPALDTRTIGQLAQTLTTADQLAGVLLEVERVLAGNVRQSAKVGFGVLLQAVAQSLPGPNAARSLVKHVRTYSPDTPQYVAGFDTLTGLPGGASGVLCLFTTCTVEFGPDGYGRTYRLVYDPTGPLQVFADGRFAGPLVPARWVLVDSAAAATSGVDTFNPLTTSYPLGKQVLYELGGYTRLFRAKVALARAAFSNDRIPTPTGLSGDAYWQEESLNPPGYVGYEVLGEQLARQLQSEEALVPGRMYRILRFDPPPQGQLAPVRAAFDVMAVAAWGGALWPQAVSIAVVGGVDGAVTAGTYDLATDTFTAAGSGSGGGDALPWAAGPQRLGQLSYSAGAVWRAKQAMANSQTAPENNPAYYELVGVLPDQRAAMAGTVDPPSAGNPFVTNNDPRLSYALRVITARDRFGTFYQGADNDLGGAVAGMAEHVVFDINQTYTSAGSVALKRGAILQGRYRSFRLAGHTLTLAQDAILQQLKIENIATNGQEGRIASTYTADNTGTPRVIDCLLYDGHYHVAAGCFLRIVGGDIAANDWNRGEGTIFLENVRVTGTTATGAGFATVVVRGAAAATNGPNYANPTVLTGPATLAANTAYHLTGSGYAVTLPPAAGAGGAPVFLSVAADATGLFPVLGAGNLQLYAGETMHLRPAPNGWQQTGGELLPMVARLETSLSQQDAIAAQNYYTVPLSQAVQTVAALPGLVDTTAHAIVVQRPARGAVTGIVTLKDCSPASTYFVGVAVTRGGAVLRPAQLIGAVSATNLLQVLVPVPEAAYEAGDVIQLYTYAEPGGANLRGQFAGSQCVLTYAEIV